MIKVNHVGFVIATNDNDTEGFTVELLADRGTIVGFVDICNRKERNKGPNIRFGVTNKFKRCGGNTVDLNWKIIRRFCGPFNGIIPK